MKITMRRLCLPGSLACRRRTGIEGRVQAHVIPPGIPTVKKSILKVDPSPIGVTQIIVTWDRPMSSTCAIESQINIKVDGAAPTHPADVKYNGVEMIMDTQSSIAAGKPVTWAYDDSGPCDLQDADGKEADNQTYAVSNLDPNDWADENGNPWEDEHSNKWTDK